MEQKSTLNRILEIYSRHTLAFWGLIIYDILGGIVACSLYPSDPLNGRWWFFGWIITLPVNIISTSYRFTESASNYSTVIIIQIIMLAPIFFIAYKIVKK